jgi:adenylate cyclase
VSFWGELKRRNVVRVAIAYIIVAWLLLQVSDTLVPALHLPEWLNSAIALLIILGLPIALLLAWAFELTPEGLKKETEVDRSESMVQSTGRKLDFVIISVLVCAVLFFAYDKFVVAPDGAEQANPAEQVEIAPSIAVLPFVNMSDDKDNEYFSDGLSEELLNLLAKIPELQVAARTSSFSFKDRPEIAVAEIARELNVANILEGSVRKAGNQIRITAQLIDAETGYHLWSETYDRKLENIFVTQDEIAVHVAEALKITLLGAAPSAQQTDPQAYELFLQAQFIALQDNMEAYRRAIELYERALAIDPGYAPAWVQLGRTNFWLASYGGLPVAEASDRIEAALAKAFQIDPNNAQAFIISGLRKIWFEFRVKDGLRDFARAQELEPGNAYVIFATGLGFNTFGQHEKALERFEAALKLDPLRPRYQNTLGLNLLKLGRYEEALETFERQITLSPEYPGAYRRISVVYIASGNYKAALAAARKEVDGGYRLTALATAHFMLGNTEAADTALNMLIEKHATHMAAQIAEVYGYRGDIDATFEWLQSAFDTRDPGLVSTLSVRPFKILHDDPRWLPLLESIELADAWLAMPPEWGGPQ